MVYQNTLDHVQRILKEHHKDYALFKKVFRTKCVILERDHQIIIQLDQEALKNFLATGQASLGQVKH